MGSWDGSRGKAELGLQQGGEKAVWGGFGSAGVVGGGRKSSAPLCEVVALPSTRLLVRTPASARCSFLYESTGALELVHQPITHEEAVLKHLLSLQMATAAGSLAGRPCSSRACFISAV